MPSSSKYSVNITWNLSVLSPHPHSVPHTVLSDWAYSEVKTVELNLKLFCACQLDIALHSLN